MKKLLSVILMVALVLSLAACGGNKGEKVTLYEDTWEGDNVSLQQISTIPKVQTSLQRVKKNIRTGLI